MSDELNIKLSFNQLLKLVMKLPKKEKLRLTEELEREGINSKLRNILNGFRPDENLTLDLIDEESELVREERYGKKA
jgi:hypothetical protein